jgi:hypothetical protein
MISCSAYKDRWYKYALQFHSNVKVPADASRLFNDYLFSWVHQALKQSLLRKRHLAQKKTSSRHWDQIVEILCRVDIDTLLQGLLTCENVATFWSDVWKVSSQFHNLNYPFDIYFLDTSQRPLRRRNCL